MSKTSLLSIVASLAFPNLLERLILAGCDVNHEDLLNQTPLCSALFPCYYTEQQLEDPATAKSARDRINNCILILINHGADPAILTDLNKK